jgi:hypothetical protein
MRPPTSRSISGEVSGKPLVGAARRQTERFGLPIAEILQDLDGNSVDIERRPPGHREVADAEDPRQPLADRFPLGGRPENNLDSPHEHADALDVQVRRGLTDIPYEPRDEPRTVVPLEGDFLVMNDDGCHFGYFAEGDTVSR